MGLDERNTVIQAARLGADWAWTALYRDLSPDVLRYAHAKRCPDPEDVVGEVFLQVVRKIPEFSGDAAAFRSWVFTIAHNKITDHLRKRGGDVLHASDTETCEPVDPHHGPEQEVLRRFSDDEVRRVLGMLSPKQRDVILLRVVVGMSIEETATVTGQTPGAVKSLQSRGLAAIRRNICGKAVSKRPAVSFTFTR